MGRLGVADKAPEVAEEATNMALDRDETARLFMASLLSRDGYDVDGDAVKAVQAADALRAALVAVKPEAVAPAPSPAPVVDAPRAPYVPKVGDRVLHFGDAECARVVIGVDPLRVFYINLGRESDADQNPGAYVYDGPATAAERVAAGLPPEAGVVASVPSVPTHKDAAPAKPASESRFIHVEGRGVLVDGVVDPFRVGDDVLIHARVRGIEGSDASVKAILLYSGCRVARTAPASKPVPVDREGLAKALRHAWWGRENDDDNPCNKPSDWLRAADAAIKFLGGAS